MNSKLYVETVLQQAGLRNHQTPALSEQEGDKLVRFFELGDVLKNGPLYAVTLHQPWPWCIFSLGKDIENRSWPYPKELSGAWIAIHASQRYDAIGAGWIQQAHPLAKVPPKSKLASGAIIGLVKLGGCLTDSTSRWFAGYGYYGWKLEEPMKLTYPVKVRGHRRFWQVPYEVRGLIYDDWKQQEQMKGQG